MGTVDRFTAESRRRVLERRSQGIGDLSNFSLAQGDWTVDQAVAAGLYRENATHMIGIATATELGLPTDRFPIRVIISCATKTATQVDTVCGYWKIMNAAGAALPFQRKPFESDVPIKNLRNLIPDLDDQFWKAWEAVKSAGDNEKFVPEQVANQDALYNILCLPNATDAQKTQATELFQTITNAYVSSGAAIAVKISPDYFVRSKPHGTNHVPNAAYTDQKEAIIEFVLTVQANYANMKARYPDISDGILSLAAYSIASMFNSGLHEAYEHKEYHTVCVTPDPGSTSSFTIVSTIASSGSQIPDAFAVTKKIDIGQTRLSKMLIELSNLMIWGSGLMHYLYNHTTGGMMVTGPLLSALGMYNMISHTTPAETQVKITSVLYESLHPTNKRAIANIHFKNSHVTTHGRSRSSPMYRKYDLDSFAQLRTTPYPAGSHKAFICATALKRVAQSGLIPFLPWAASVNQAINSCKEVLSYGARAHIGSGYYTGDAPIAQSSSLDDYLPEIACFIQAFNKYDSLAMSPHLSVDIASRAAMNWTNLIKDIKAKDVSATSAEVVKKYLSTQGQLVLNFDPEKEDTWANAAGQSRVAIAALENIFN